MISAPARKTIGNKIPLLLRRNRIKIPVLIDRVPKAHRAVQICLDRIDDLRTTYPAGYYLGIKGWLYQLFFILESEILAPDKMREITTCDLPQQKKQCCFLPEKRLF